jgi:hippurate hydrolase
MNTRLFSTIAVPGELFGTMVALRRDLLDRLRIEHQTGVAGHGIVAEIAGRGDGPAIALRADLDALPVQEETGLPFASVHEGVMHACGHDGHSAMLVGAAALLASGEPPPVPVRLFWQPAEERADGAIPMIEAGVLDGVAMVFGGHVDRHYPVSQLVVTEGTVNASTDGFSIEIRGRQGHGARPHEAVDAVVVGSLLVTALQTIVSREVDPAHPSVVSVGAFHAGTAANVIAGRARLEGTIRAQEHEVRAQLRQAVIRVSKAIGELHGADVQVELQDGVPPVINTPEMVDLAREAAIAVVGEDAVTTLRSANMGGEDFAYYLEKVPGCYIRVGAQVPGREGFPAHSSRFDFHEDAMAVGAAWMTQVARLAAARVAEGIPAAAAAS